MGVRIWQHKYLITRKACAAVAQACLTPWALSLFSHLMICLLFQVPRGGASWRVDMSLVTLKEPPPSRCISRMHYKDMSRHWGPSCPETGHFQVTRGF